MAHPISSFKPEFCDIAVNVLATGESLAAICDELDICRTTLYEWRDKHPEFAQAIQKGLQKAQRDWERLGREGITGNLDKFSTTGWIFTMKNRFRADYAEDKSESKTLSDTIVEKLIDKLVD
jgi:hypothetical protein